MIRTAFWLSVVVMLLPADNNDTPDVKNGAVEPVSAIEALDAARTTVTDLSGFCGRNQSVCQTGQQAFALFASKARYGARVIYDWASSNEPLAGQSATQPAGKPQLSALNPKIVTGSLKVAGAQNAATRSTLTREDLIPVWGGPARRSKA